MATASPPMTRETATELEMAAAEAYTRDKYLACALLAGACRHRYGKLIEDLENDYTMANDKYPKSMTEAYNLLVYWKQYPRNLMRVVGTSSDGVAFTNMGDEAEGVEAPLKKAKKREGKAHITCHKCAKLGHYASECPKLTGVQLLMEGVETEPDQKVSWQFLTSGVCTEHPGMDGGATKGTTGTTLHQQKEGRLPKSWILLDNQ
jgi:hypothetical protein